MKKLILLAFVTVAVTGCNGCNNTRNTENNGSETVVAEIEAISDGHNSQNSLDYAGTYRGTVPCADCEGIKMELTLNSDGTYELKAEYLGKPVDSNYEDKGTFTWDPTGSMITLSGNPDGPRRFKVGENRIWLLDENYKEITGENADKYILKK